jgi:hypothetical protein
MKKIGSQRAEGRLSGILRSRPDLGPSRGRQRLTVWGIHYHPLSFRLQYSADAMDEDTDIEEIANPGVAEKQQRSGGRPPARPILKSQGRSFHLILTLAL